MSDQAHTRVDLDVDAELARYNFDRSELSAMTLAQIRAKESTTLIRLHKGGIRFRRVLSARVRRACAEARMGLEAPSAAA